MCAASPSSVLGPVSPLSPLSPFFLLPLVQVKAGARCPSQPVFLSHGSALGDKAGCGAQDAGLVAHACNPIPWRWRQEGEAKIIGEAELKAWPFLLEPLCSK